VGDAVSYRLMEIEVTTPLPAVALVAGEDGYALTLRRKGRAVGFVMRAQPSGTTVSPDDVSKLLAQEVGLKLLEEAVREELGPPPAPAVEAPSLTIAICTKDRPDLVDRCLRSIIVTGLAPGGWTSIEILVIDNAPSDSRTSQVVSTYNQARRILEERPGLNFARNRALQEAQGDLLAFLDDDVVVDQNWCAGLYEAWSENIDAGAFTGLVLPYELSTEAQILFERRGGFRRGFDKVRHGVDASHPWYPCSAGTFGAGCNCAFRRDLLLRLGGFDEALDTGAPLPGGGDLDIFFRVIRAGCPIVYEPQYLVYHEHRRDLVKLRQQYWSWGLGFMAFAAKSYQADPPMRSRFRALLIWWFKDHLKQLARAIAGRHVLPPSFIAAELAGGFLGIFGEYRRSERRIERIRRSFV
jgi:glycosyltransferase involved in cell wall biosynthesis